MAWSLLQSASSASTGTTTGTVAKAFTAANLSSGSTLIAAVAIAGAKTVSSVKDTAGNSFVLMKTVTFASKVTVAVFALNTPSGDVGTKPTITATLSASGSESSLLIQEVAGLATGTTLATLVDGTPGGLDGTGGSSTGSPSYTSTASSEYLIAVYGDDGGPATWTKPSALTADTNSVNSNSYADIAIAYGNSTNGTEAGSWALAGSSADWNAFLFAFKIVAGTTVTASGAPEAAVVVTATAARYADAAAARAVAAVPQATATAIHKAAPAVSAAAVITASATVIHKAKAAVDAAAVPSATATDISGIPISAAPAVAAVAEATAARSADATAARPAVASITASATTIHKAAATRAAVAGIKATATGVRKASALLKPTAASQAALTVGEGLPVLVQQVVGGGESDYGFSSTQISSTTGNGLVLFAGWDLHNAPTTAPVPALYVADSAGNYWYHLGTSPAGGYGSRCTIWCCPNAQAVTWVSACMTAYANSLVYTVCEIANFPDFAALDLSTSGFVNADIPSEQVFSSAGSGHWQAPAGVSDVAVQNWAAGGGSTSNGFGAAGGAEYAADPAVAVTPGNLYAYTVGKGGAQGATWDTSGHNGGNTTFAGNSVTVTAHGGKGALINTDTGQAGGTGSSNAVHHNGGAGGNGSATAGGGGGGSGGPASAGTAGGNASGTTPGAGAGAVSLGGPGGAGGALQKAGNPPPSGPGGGAGTGGDVFGAPTPLTGAPGADGQIVLTYSVSSPTSIALSGTTASADLAFAMIGAGAGDMTLTSGPSGWTALGSGVTIGGAGPDGMTIFPYWKNSVSASTNLTPSWTVTPAVALSATMAAIEASPATPSQPNANFPILKIEIAEGFTPGDPTATPPTWTDITARCISKDGDSFITTAYGQEYELSTPEAGELVIGVNNFDGAFTPNNVASPYYPYVVLGMPVRVSAYWDGLWYQVAYGYVERWPQEWPDLPQWGLSKLTCTDSIAVLTSTTMPSALWGDILADAPYAFFPLSEQYLSSVNGLTNASGPIYSYTSAETAGLLAANASRVNQRAAMYCDGTQEMETGLALNLNGDQGTAAGTSSFSGSISYAAPVSGPGVIYSDPNMPDPTNADGCTVEIWFLYSFAETSGQGLTLFTAYGPSPSSYWPTTSLTPAASGPASFVLQLVSTTNTVQLILNGTTVNVGGFTPGGNAQQLVVTFPPSGSDAVNVYLNGALLGTATLSGGEVTAWTAFVAGPANYAYSANPLSQNYVAGFATLYPYELSGGRAASHYNTGANGASGSNVSQSAAQILSWGYLGLPHGGPEYFGTGNTADDGIHMGPFYSLAGSTAADGLNQCVLSDGGMMYAAPSGVLIILPRWALFNMAPGGTFGDAPLLSQVPYLEGQAFDFDNTYLYNIVQVTRSDGSTTSITAQIKNTASQLAYFTRSALQQTISTTSDLDAYTLADWESGEYAQPSMRVRSLEVDAASNPAAAFPLVLGTTVSNVMNVTRNPVGGVPVSGAYLVQKVSHKIGPTMWRTSFEMSPYTQASAVLATDTAGFNVLGSNSLS